VVQDIGPEISGALCKDVGGCVNIEGYDFMDFAWYSINTPEQILSSTSEFCVGEAIGQTVHDVYEVRVSFDEGLDCYEKVLQVEFTGCCRDADDGCDMTDDFADPITCEVTHTPINQPEQVNCWDAFTFDFEACMWRNNGVMPPVPSDTDCVDDYEFDEELCTWIPINSTLEETPPQINCWDEFVVDDETCEWTNIGVPPVEPLPSNCWDAFELNKDLCQWENVGVEPTEPLSENCWEVYEYDEVACEWVKIGSLPAAPEVINCWDAFNFDNERCEWFNDGTEPAIPPKVNCWDDFEFDKSDCTWVNVGSALEFDLDEDQEINLGDSLYLGDVVDLELGEVAWTTEDSVSTLEYSGTYIQPAASQVVYLSVTTEEGCIYSDSIFIKVVANKDCYAPNVFQLSASGDDNHFQIYGGGDIASYNLLIYNRWGNLIYEGVDLTDEDEGWDGRYNNDLVLSGIYLWSAEITFLDSTTKRKSGSVTVLE